jgi:hypothetical protein
MRVPLFVVVAQWVLLLALGLLVIVMYRQLGHAFSSRRPRGELGPPVGSSAAGFDYASVSDDSMQRFEPGGGQPALLAFVEPSCQACEKLVAAVGAVARAGDLSGLRVLLLMSDPPSYLQISEAFRSTSLEIGRIMTRATAVAYKATATPLLVAIDAEGFVRSAGPAIEVDEVRAFRQACLLTPAAATLTVVPAGPRADRDEGADPANGSERTQR